MKLKDISTQFASFLQTNGDVETIETSEKFGKHQARSSNLTLAKSADGTRITMTNPNRSVSAMYTGQDQQELKSPARMSAELKQMHRTLKSRQMSITEIKSQSDDFMRALEKDYAESIPKDETVKKPELLNQAEKLVRDGAEIIPIEFMDELHLQNRLLPALYHAYTENRSAFALQLFMHYYLQSSEQVQQQMQQKFQEIASAFRDFAKSYDAQPATNGDRVGNHIEGSSRVVREPWGDITLVSSLKRV